MNTNIISHRMFVAALAAESGGPTQSATGTAGRPLTNGAHLRPAANALTVEQLAALAARYWPDFPFGLWEERPAL